MKAPSEKSTANQRKEHIVVQWDTPLTDNQATTRPHLSSIVQARCFSLFGHTVRMP